MINSLTLIPHDVYIPLDLGLMLHFIHRPQKTATLVVWTLKLNLSSRARALNETLSSNYIGLKQP